MKTEKQIVRETVNYCLRKMGLQYRCSKLVLDPTLKLDGKPVWAWMRLSSTPGCFHLYVQTGQNSADLVKTIVHELTHILTSELITAVSNPNGKGSNTMISEVDVLRWLVSMGSLDTVVHSLLIMVEDELMDQDKEAQLEKLRVYANNLRAALGLKRIR